MADVAVHDVAQAGDRAVGEHRVEAAAAGGLGRVHARVGDEPRARHHPHQPRPALHRLRAAAGWRSCFWIRGGSSFGSDRRRWLQDHGECDEQGDHQRVLARPRHRSTLVSLSLSFVSCAAVALLHSRRTVLLMYLVSTKTVRGC